MYQTSIRNKKQKKMIEQYALDRYKEKQGHINQFTPAYKLDIYDALNDINCYEDMDSDIERYYGSFVVNLKVNGV